MKWLSAQAKALGVSEHVYVVGGAVRNWVIKQPIKDIDMMIDSLSLGKGRDSAWFAEQISKAIPAKTSFVTNQYGVAILTVSGPWELDGIDMQGEVIEIANARSESYGGHEGKGYKPDDVKPATIEQDVKRREFSFNTLMWRLSQLAEGPDKAEIIDLTGKGLKDLEAGIMDTPSDPDKTFSDDPTRMIRAIKFIVKYGFKVKGEVANSIRRNAEKLKNVPANAVATLLVDVVLKDRKTGKKALPEMRKLGLLDVITEMLKENKEFRNQMVRWAGKRELAYLFDLLDVGLPLGKSISFLGDSEAKRLRELSLTMSQEESSALLLALKQPGKAFGDKQFLPDLAETLGVPKKGMGEFAGKVTSVTRALLLKNPRLLQHKSKLRSLVRQRVDSGYGRKLAVFDFDGTLFGSPDAPPGEKNGGWHADIKSLTEPLVPRKPGSSWWNEDMVKKARRAIASKDTFAVMITGRTSKKANLRYRIAELLRGKGLDFDAVYMSPLHNTPLFKGRAVAQLVSSHDISEVEAWDDRQDNLDSMKEELPDTTFVGNLVPRFEAPTRRETSSPQ